MIPIDFRNATFDDLRGRLQSQRLIVFEAWLRHGPGTTEAVARGAGISILSFRPRTTELYQLGAIECVDGTPDGRPHSGIYRARTETEWRAWLARKQSTHASQLQLV